jgi:hypothetical protein
MIATFLLVAILTEALTETIKLALPDVAIKGKATYFVSLSLGIVMAYAFGLNIFGLTGAGYHASVIAAGLIASRGANYVNGFMKQIGALRPTK